MCEQTDLWRGVNIAAGVRLAVAVPQPRGAPVHQIGAVGRDAGRTDSREGARSTGAGIQTDLRKRSLISTTETAGNRAQVIHKLLGGVTGFQSIFNGCALAAMDDAVSFGAHPREALPKRLVGYGVSGQSFIELAHPGFAQIVIANDPRERLLQVADPSAFIQLSKHLFRPQLTRDLSRDEGGFGMILLDQLSRACQQLVMVWGLIEQQQQGHGFDSI